MKSKVENDADFQDLENNDDVVGLLNKLKELAFSMGGVQHPHWTLQKVLQCLTSVSQGSKEMVQNHHERFLALTKGIKAQWGEFSPPGSVADIAAVKMKKARDQLSSVMFMAGGDRLRHGKLADDLNNSCLTGLDKWPGLADATLTLLLHHQGHTSGGGVKKVTSNEVTETGFAQSGGKRLSQICCFKCSELGHVKAGCPKNKAQLQQEEEELDGKSSNTKCQMASWCRWSDSHHLSMQNQRSVLVK